MGVVFTNKMKRKVSRTDETSKKNKRVGDDILAWDIFIKKLDFESQMKISQQNRHLANVVNLNAQHQLKKFERHIREDKYIGRTYSSPNNWSFYRALIHI